MTQWFWRCKFLIGIFFIAVAVSCSNKANTKYEFYYYPKVNMYYNMADSQYVYSLDSARTWNSIPASSEYFTQTLGEKIIIHSATKEVWKENQQHRQQYHGTIYNIVSTDSGAAEVENDVKERKVEVMKPVTTEKPRKTGVGRFLQKLFGKKKD